MASCFVGWVKTRKLGVALAPTPALNGVRLGEASGKEAAFNLLPK